MGRTRHNEEVLAELPYCQKNKCYWRRQKDGICLWCLPNPVGQGGKCNQVEWRGIGGRVKHKYIISVF